MKRILISVRSICTKQNLLSPKAILLYFILLKLLICFFPVNYDYFRDELYYIAMSDRLDYGYVDVPPAAPFLLAAIKTVFGISHYSLHLLTAASGALILIIVYHIIKKLEGDRFSLVLALSCTTLAPIYMAVENMFTYDHLDKLWWALLLYFMVCIIKTHNGKYWLYFGITAGVALMLSTPCLLNKICPSWYVRRPIYR
ncbi:MAG: glycosyltransferase family 39 protein [Spirochaetales bacterium]|nr:glycosyltransferase family 39 protein [Spirochaetales bacterium]